METLLMVSRIIDVVLRNVTRSSSGQIDFNEFLEMMIKCDTKIEEDVTRHAFRYD